MQLQPNQMLFKTRANFTSLWGSIPRNMRSLLISGMGIPVAYLAYRLGMWAFPEADFSALATLIIGALSTWIAAVLKNQFEI